MVQEQTSEIGLIFEAAYFWNAIVFQPQGLQTSVGFQVFNSRESLSRKNTKHDLK